MSQDEIFFASEGDAWFRRNRAAQQDIGSGKAHDWPGELALDLARRTQPSSILELGCSQGARLAFLRNAIGGSVRCVGVDASREAVEEGSRAYPGIDLRHGLLNAVPLDGVYDLVILNFVLHWVDRVSLARSLSEVDRLVKDGGYLVLGDFAPDYPQRRRYHHLKDERVYTFKQDYAALFKALGTYASVRRVTYNQDLKEHPILPTESGNRAFCEVLAKSSYGYYPEMAS
jgi:SAM-dependent methyltransferase